MFSPQNALLSGEDDRRVVTLKALTPCEYMVVDRGIFNWFISQYPHAMLSFVLTTTCRQWRVAYVTLVDILGAYNTRLVADARLLINRCVLQVSRALMS